MNVCCLLSATPVLAVQIKRFFFVSFPQKLFFSFLSHNFLLSTIYSSKNSLYKERYVHHGSCPILFQHSTEVGISIQLGLRIYKLRNCSERACQSLFQEQLISPHFSHACLHMDRQTKLKSTFQLMLKHAKTSIVNVKLCVNRCEYITN